MPQFGEFETTKQRIGSSLGNKEVFVARRKGRDGFAIHVFAEPDFLTEEDGPKRAAFIKMAKRLQLMNRSAGNGWAVVYDIGETRGSTYYATDLFAHPNSTGATILPYNLERLYKARVQLSNESLAWTILQVARALQHAGGFGRHGNLHNKNVLLATKNPTTVVGARVVLIDPAPEAGATERDRRAVAELIHELCLFKKMPEGEMPFMPPAEEWKGAAGRDGGFWRSLVSDLINVDVGSRLSLEGLIELTRRRVGADGETKDQSFQEEDKAKTRSQGVQDTVAMPPPSASPQSPAADVTRAIPVAEDEDALRERRRREQAEARRKQEEEWAKQDAEEKKRQEQEAQRKQAAEAQRQREAQLAREAEVQRQQAEAVRQKADAERAAQARETARLEEEKKAKAQQLERERLAREAQEREAREREAKLREQKEREAKEREASERATKEREANRLAMEEAKRRAEQQRAANATPAAEQTISTEPFEAKPQRAAQPAAKSEAKSEASAVATAAGQADSQPAVEKKSVMPLVFAGVIGVAALGLAGAWLGGVFDGKPKGGSTVVVTPPPPPPVTPPVTPPPVPPVTPEPTDRTVVTRPTDKPSDSPVLPPSDVQRRQQGERALDAIEKPSTQAGKRWLEGAVTTLKGRDEISPDVAGRLRQVRDAAESGFVAASAIELSIGEIKRELSADAGIGPSLDAIAALKNQQLQKLEGLDGARTIDPQQANQLIAEASTISTQLQGLQREVDVLDKIAADVTAITGSDAKLAGPALEAARAAAAKSQETAGALKEESVQAAAAAVIDKLTQRLALDAAADAAAGAAAVAAAMAKLEQASLGDVLAATNDPQPAVQERAVQIVRERPVTGLTAASAGQLIAGADSAKLADGDRQGFKQRVVEAVLQQPPATLADLDAIKQLIEKHATPNLAQRFKGLLDYNQLALQVRESAGATPAQLQQWGDSLEKMKQDPIAGQAAKALAAMLAGIATPIVQQGPAFGAPAGWSGGPPNAAGVVSLTRSASPGNGIAMEFVDVGGGRFVARREVSYTEFMGLGIAFGRDRRQPQGVSIWQYDGTRVSTRTDWHRSIMASESGQIFWIVNSSNQPARRADVAKYGFELAAGSESNRPIQMIRADEAKDAAAQLSMDLPTAADFARAQQLELQQRGQRPPTLADNVRGPAWTQQATAMQGLPREADVGAYFKIMPPNPQIQRDPASVWTAATVPGVVPPAENVDFFVDVSEQRGSAIFNLFGNVAEWTSEGAIVGPSSLSPPVPATLQPNTDPTNRQASVARAYVDVGMRLAFSAGAGQSTTREPTVAEIGERFQQIKPQVQVIGGQ